MRDAYARLTGMDSSFLVLEGDNAHMHVGWVSMFGHQMDVGGPLPGSFPMEMRPGGRFSRAPSSWASASRRST